MKIDKILKRVIIASDDLKSCVKNFCEKNFGKTIVVEHKTFPAKQNEEALYSIKGDIIFDYRKILKDNNLSTDVYPPFHDGKKLSLGSTNKLVQNLLSEINDDYNIKLAWEK